MRILIASDTDEHMHEAVCGANHGAAVCSFERSCIVSDECDRLVALRTRAEALLAELR